MPYTFTSNRFNALNNNKNNNKNNNLNNNGIKIIWNYFFLNL